MRPSDVGLLRGASTCGPSKEEKEQGTPDLSFAFEFRSVQGVGGSGVEGRAIPTLLCGGVGLNSESRASSRASSWRAAVDSWDQPCRARRARDNAFTQSPELFTFPTPRPRQIKGPLTRAGVKLALDQECLMKTRQSFSSFPVLPAFSSRDIPV
jgi:hypothetical protein